MDSTKSKLKDVAVFCPKLRPSDAVRLAHIKALQKSAAKYPLRRVEVKSFTLPRGNLSWTKESMFLGQLPKRLIVGFVDNDAYNGSFQKNPFNFNHYNINFLSLVKDGEQIFSKALQPDFDNKNSCEATSLFSLKLTSTTQTKETASLDPTRWRTHSVCVWFDSWSRLSCRPVGVGQARESCVRKCDSERRWQRPSARLCMQNSTICAKSPRQKTLFSISPPEHEHSTDWQCFAQRPVHSISVSRRVRSRQIATKSRLAFDFCLELG